MVGMPIGVRAIVQRIGIDIAGMTMRVIGTIMMMTVTGLLTLMHGRRAYEGGHRLREPLEGHHCEGNRKD
jgi:hypothetical protein